MGRRISRFNQRIVIQKNAATVDGYGNHTNAWTDYFTCWAYASTYQYDKERETAVTEHEQTVSFEVRYCSDLAELTSTGYRVVFNGNVYDIISVDMMNYQSKTIRIRSMLIQSTTSNQGG